MSVSAVLQALLKVTESVTQSGTLSNSREDLHTLDAGDTINANSTVPATKVASYNDQALTAGALSIDLTSLTDPYGNSVDMSGLKVQRFFFQWDEDNTDTCTIVDGASNGYNLFGDASGQVTLNPGDSVLLIMTDQHADVAAGAKTIDISSSDTDGVFDCIIVAG